MRRLAPLALCLAAIWPLGCGGSDGNEYAEPTQAAPPTESSSEFEIEVDRRVELLSVLCRMASVPPSQQAATPYALAVDEHFAPVRGHPAVTATGALAREHGISYAAPVELAAYLDDSFRPIRPLAPPPPGLDPRWEEVDLGAYLRQVRDFAAAARFDEFIESQSSHHTAVEDAYRDFLAGTPILGWFDSVFGERRRATYRVVPGLLTGDFAFGTTAESSDGTVDVAQVLYLESPNEEGLPQPTDRSLEFLVHELAHSYVNPVFDARVEEMRASALPLFEWVEAAMREQAYTRYPIMVNESVVRAVTVLFLRERVSEAAAQRSLDEQRRLSFFWTPELVEALDAELRNSGLLEPKPLVEIAQRVFTEARR